MRILLDECVPRQLKKELAGYTVKTATEAGWASIKNGALLRLAEGSFDVLVTVDRGMRYQQNISKYNISLVVLVVRRSNFATLQPLIPALLEAISAAQSGTVTHIGSGF